jgi:exonuclease III
MMDKPLTLASLNVRGLRGGSTKPKEIKAWLASILTRPQILLLQEHHLEKDGIQDSARGIEFWKGSAFWNEGIPMGRSQKTSAGTTILVDRATAPLVKEHDILMEGCTQFITLQSSENRTLTIINIYAPRSSNNRAPLRCKINRVDFTADHIIVGGDFNHLEEIYRRGTVGERQMHKREVASWHHMMLHYRLVDA